MKLREFYKTLTEFYGTPAGEILTGFGEAAAIIGAGLYGISRIDGSQITIGALTAFSLTHPAARIGDGIWDIYGNMKAKKQWNDARF
jgi:hypothetical protein